jgi:acyl dehydratase
VGITGSNNYFEDFAVGDVYEHARGRTVIHFDNYSVTHMSMNTAQHYNEEFCRKLLNGAFRTRLVLGPFTLSLIVGLTTEDMSENSFMDIGMTGIRLPNPVYEGDTLYAKSEVLEVCDASDRDDAGIMRYRFTGFNSEGKTVAEGERTVLVKKRAAWAGRDGNASHEVATQ